MTKTKSSKAAKTAEQGMISGAAGWEDISGSLPPMAVLAIGEKCQGLIKRVDVRTETTGKGKNVKTQHRVYFQMTLAAVTEVHDKNGDTVIFEKGQLITLPGSGALNRALGLQAYRASSQQPPEDLDESTTPWNALEGFEVLVSRQEDGKIKKGPFAGKGVKQYKVLIRKP